MKSIKWALLLMGASVVLAWGCAGGGAFVPEFNDDAPCHPSVKLAMTVDPSQVTIIPGGHGDIEIRVRDLNAPAPDLPKNGNTVLLSLVGTLPNGVTHDFSPSGVTPTYQGVVSSLMIHVPSTTPAGSHPVYVQGKVGGCEVRVPLTVNVGSIGTQPFLLYSVFSTASARQGESIQLPFVITTNTAYRPDSRVPFTYTLTGPAEFQRTFTVTPADLTPTFAGVSLTLFLTVGSETPPGSYNLTLTASDGSQQDSETFPLIVTSGDAA